MSARSERGALLRRDADVSRRVHAIVEKLRKRGRWSAGFDTSGMRSLLQKFADQPMMTQFSEQGVTHRTTFFNSLAAHLAGVKPRPVSATANGAPVDLDSVRISDSAHELMRENRNLRFGEALKAARRHDAEEAQPTFAGRVPIDPDSIEIDKTARTLMSENENLSFGEALKAARKYVPVRHILAGANSTFKAGAPWHLGRAIPDDPQARMVHLRAGAISDEFPEMDEETAKEYAQYEISSGHCPILNKPGWSVPVAGTE